MIYSLSLQTVGVLLGLFLLITHGVALLHSAGVQNLLKGFPRSRVAGIVLLTIDLIWALILLKNMDLGEFTKWREALLVVIVVMYFAMLFFVEEFLAVRALGVLCLLVAEPMIEAAFLKPEMTRLLVVALAYVWAILGLFWVGMPYLLRDQITWVTSSLGRWKLATLGGVVYGALTLASALLFYGKVS